MTDRELLELAALAAINAGHKIDVDMLCVWDNARGNWADWNPLTDSGDALELAVKLRLETEFGANFVTVGSSQQDGEWFLASEAGAHVMSDPIYATRRAIVRAAAQIGKQLRTET